MILCKTGLKFLFSSRQKRFQLQPATGQGEADFPFDSVRKACIFSLPIFQSGKTAIVSLVLFILRKILEGVQDIDPPPIFLSISPAILFAVMSSIGSVRFFAEFLQTGLPVHPKRRNDYPPVCGHFPYIPRSGCFDGIFLLCPRKADKSAY
jgi:hypothetical protein